MDSRRRLLTAMHDLLGQNSIYKITVKQLLETADVSRGTFYTYFPDKYALMNSYFRDAVHQHMQGAVSDPWVTILEKGGLFLKANQAYFTEAMKSTGQNSFLEFLVDDSLKNVRYGLLLRSGKQRLSELDEQRIQFFVAGYTQLTRNWIASGMVEDPVQLAETIYDLMPAELKQYLW